MRAAGDITDPIGRTTDLVDITSVATSAERHSCHWPILRSWVQREYDDLEAALLQMLPEFREYLAANDSDERWLQEQRLSTHPDFLRWKTLVAEIAALYAAKGPRQ